MEGPREVDFPDPPLRTRREIFVLLVGVTVGLLVATLLVPIVFGDEISDSNPGAATVTPFSVPPTDGTAGPSPEAPGTQPAAAPVEGVAPGPRSAAIGPASTVPLAERTASDIGVTPEVIRIGIPIPDTGPVLAAGFKALTVEQTKQLWTVMLEIGRASCRERVYCGAEQGT